MNGTTESSAADRRRAARILLRNPSLTAATDPDALAFVRRHGAQLRPLFATRFGYVLTIESTFARLAKMPLPPWAPRRPAMRRSGTPFTPRTYTYLALVSAALLSPAVGEQVLISGLADQVRADAVQAGVQLDDTRENARELVQVLHLLTDWGVISETEGTVAAWGARSEEALLDVNRPLLALQVPRTLRDVDTVTDLLEAPSGHGRPEEPRRSLRRKLVENPIVRREDLTDAERDVLSRERRDLERMFDEDFGLLLEVRAEGALLYDVEDDVTDITFPGRGTVPHATLLLTNALIDVLDPKPGSSVTYPDGRTCTGVLAGWDVVAENIALLIDQYGTTFGAAYATNPDLLADEVADLLAAVGLAERHPDGLVLFPACARYRPEPQRAPAKRSSRTSEPVTDLADLFTEETA